MKCRRYCYKLQRGLIWQFQHIGKQEAAEGGGLSPVYHSYRPPHHWRHLQEQAPIIKDPHHPMPSSRYYCRAGGADARGPTPSSIFSSSSCGIHLHNPKSHLRKGTLCTTSCTTFRFIFWMRFCIMSGLFSNLFSFHYQNAEYPCYNKLQGKNK